MDSGEALGQLRPEPLSKTKLLLVEGRDDYEFFRALLAHLGGMPEIDIRQYLGKDNFRNYMRALKLVRGFSAVTSIGIIRDADETSDGAFRSVKDALVAVGISAPDESMQRSEGSPSTAIAILPPGQSKGELEDLLLSSVNGDPAISCVDAYISCLQTHGLKLPNKLSKARLRTFLASREEPHLLTGQAARTGYFPWSSTPFESVIQFLQLL